MSTPGDTRATITEPSIIEPSPGDEWTTDAGLSRRSRRRHPYRWIAVLGIVILVVGAAVAYRRSTSGSSWTTTWSDSFSGSDGTAPSGANWKTSTGTSYPGGAAQWGTGETETYTASRNNLALDGKGHLKITAIRDSAGAWTSGRIETQQTGFQAAPGHVLRVEARIQTPSSGAGYWPAFWMLGAPFRGVYTNWPGIGEIDIMENAGGRADTVNGTLHCGVAPGGPCNENKGIGGKHTGTSPFSAGFHTFAVEWDRTRPVEEIRWYVDGQNYFTVRSSQVDATTWANATHHGFFILLDLAVGGSFPGPTDAATKPNGSMLVDYVRVSSK